MPSTGAESKKKSVAIMVNWLKNRFFNAPMALMAQAEARAISFSSAIERAIEEQAGDAAQDAIQTGLAAQEACAGLWERAFASATIASGNRARQVCRPSMLALVAREFVYSGESAWLLDVLDDGRLAAGVASSWEVNGSGVHPEGWRYRLDVLGPSGNRTRRAEWMGVLHFMIGRQPSQPWKGQSPLEHAGVTRKLANLLEARLGEETAAQVGNIIALPRDPGPRQKPDGSMFDPLEDTRKALSSIRGKTVLVETTASGWGEGRFSAPRNDWKPQRIGPDPPSSLAALRNDVTRIILAALGVPPPLLQDNSDGTAQRESWRRFLHGTIQPVANIVAEELSIKLDEEVRIGFDELFASDLSGRARAFQSMVQGGMDVAKAAQLAGLMDMEN